MVAKPVLVGILKGKGREADVTKDWFPMSSAHQRRGYAKSSPALLINQLGGSGLDSINPFYHLAACEGGFIEN